MAGRLTGTLTSIVLLTGSVVAGTLALTLVTGSPATSTMRPVDDPGTVPMPQLIPLLPGPVPNPHAVPVRPGPVPMPLVDPDGSAGHLVPQELGRGR